MFRIKTLSSFFLNLPFDGRNDGLLLLFKQFEFSVQSLQFGSALKNFFIILMLFIMFILILLNFPKSNFLGLSLHFVECVKHLIISHGIFKYIINRNSCHQLSNCRKSCKCYKMKLRIYSMQLLSILKLLVFRLNIRILLNNWLSYWQIAVKVLMIWKTC